jgi:hypothetical protein
MVNDPDVFFRGIFDFLELHEMDIDTNRIYNKSFVPRSLFVSRVFDFLIRFRKIFHLVFPHSLLIRAKNRYKAANRKEKFDLNPKDKEYLRSLYVDDVIETGRLLGLDLMQKWNLNKPTLS